MTATEAPKCTCSEIQINLVGCDCAADHFYDRPVVPAHPDSAARQAHRDSVIAAARVDAEKNIDNRASYAASSADFYAYCAEWEWACKRIDAETSAA